MPERKPCGTTAAYRRGCHCDLCREAQHEYYEQNKTKLLANARRYRARNAKPKVQPSPFHALVKTFD